MVDIKRNPLALAISFQKGIADMSAYFVPSHMSLCSVPLDVSWHSVSSNVALCCPFRHVMAVCPFQQVLYPFRYGSMPHTLLGYLFWGQFGAWLWLQSTEHIPGLPEAALGLLEYIWNTRNSKHQEDRRRRTFYGVTSQLSVPRKNQKTLQNEEQSSTPATE